MDKPGVRGGANLKPIARVRVSALAGLDCPRRIILYLLQRASGFEDKIAFNGYLLAGRILHELLQGLFRSSRSVSQIEYLHSREGLGMEDSILAAMNQSFGNWASFATSDRFPFSNNIDDIALALNRVERQMPLLARMSVGLLFETDAYLESRCVADEFIVQALLSDFLLVGHIDLVAIKDDTLMLIELKTGRKKQMDSTQLQLYGDIVQRSNPNTDIGLEIWYSRTGEIRKLEPSGGDVLRNLEIIMDLLGKIGTMTDLPAPNRSAEDCRYCQYCDDADSILSRYHEARLKRS